ncbi:AMP-binding protein, partial [Rhodococcus hoagii]|nr:AMP-binding protein [Prescottella equi]
MPSRSPQRRLGGRHRRRFAQQVKAVAKGLMASGIELGDRVAILSGTRYEWVVLDYAIWTAGGCHRRHLRHVVRGPGPWILEDSTSLLVVENSSHAETVKDVAEAAPSLREVLQIEAGAL